MSQFQNTVAQIASFINGQHPDLCARSVATHKAHLSQKIKNIHNNTIAYGPFKGMRFTDDSHWSEDDKGPMILGLYEQELLVELATLKSQYRHFIDLGAADGYYGVGTLVNRMFDTSTCYEMSEKGREIIKRNAGLNGVSERVVIKGEATRDFAKEWSVSDLEKSILFVDIEGGEFDLLSRDVFKQFSRSVIFVELHELFFNDGDHRLRSLMDAAHSTHTERRIRMGQRDLSVYPELARWNDTDRWLLCSENRPYLMSWARFDPIA